MAGRSYGPFNFMSKQNRAGAFRTRKCSRLIKGSKIPPKMQGRHGIDRRSGRYYVENPIQGSWVYCLGRAMGRIWQDLGRGYLFERMSPLATNSREVRMAQLGDQAGPSRTSLPGIGEGAKATELLLGLWAVDRHVHRPYSR